MSVLSSSPARLSTALLVVAGVLWGTGGLAGALLQSAAGISPVAVAAYRLLVGGGLAAAAVVAAGHLRYLRGRVARTRLVISGVLLAQFQAAYQVAVAEISVSLATLITIGCVPVVVVGVGAVRERRLPATRTSVAVLGSVAGLLLLSGGPAGVDAWHTVVGVTMSVLAGAGFAVLTLVTARPVPGQHAITSFGLLLGGLLLAPFAAPVPLTADVLTLVAFLGLVPTAVAYGAYFVGLRHAHPTAAALATMLEPLTATVLSVCLHDEHLTGTGVLGAVLIAGALGLYYVRR